MRAVVAGERRAHQWCVDNLPFVNNKQLVGLAVTGGSASPPLRSADFEKPSCPAAVRHLARIVVASGTPPAVIARLNAEISRFWRHQNSRPRSPNRAAKSASNPATMATWLKDSTKRWGDIIREAGIRANDAT